MIEVEDLTDEEETRLAAADQKSADEFVLRLKALPEEERDEQIKFIHKALAEGSRLLVKANMIISEYAASEAARKRAWPQA